MMEYFEKLYYWHEFIDLDLGNNVYYIGCTSLDQRSENEPFLMDLESKCVCTPFLLKYDYDSDSFLCNDKRYSLKAETRKLIDNLDTGIPVILNITAMNLRLLGSLLFHIKKHRFLAVYCIYTEPFRYRKKVPVGDHQDRFELYKRFRGIEPIPGFLRGNDENLDERWVVFLGFEGKRSEQIYEKYEFENIVPVITLPSYQPGWHNYALEENMDLMKRAERKPEYIIANSYLSAYSYLEQIVNSSPQLYIRVSPLGTKINALGALLFSLNTPENFEILYDNPIADEKMSEKAGKTYVFDISDVINMHVGG